MFPLVFPLRRWLCEKLEWHEAFECTNTLMQGPQTTPHKCVATQGPSPLRQEPTISRFLGASSESPGSCRMRVIGALVSNSFDIYTKRYVTKHLVYLQKICVWTSDSVLSRTVIFPGMREGNVVQFQWICTGFVAQRDQGVGEHQRRTAWWARHSENTSNDHVVQTF